MFLQNRLWIHEDISHFSSQVFPFKEIYPRGWPSNIFLTGLFSINQANDLAPKNIFIRHAVCLSRL